VNTSVIVERVVAHPVERVFAVWLDGATFAEWFLPDPNVRLGRVQLDPREGGAFLIEMIVGGETLAHTGVYRRIVPNREIAFTWRSAMIGDGESLVEVTFEAKDDATLLRLRHTGLTFDEMRSAHRSGWTHILGGLDPFLSDE
jgi:uncharacterized protein YndB with AHSA1/START domain